MEVKIGVQYAMRELSVETDETAEAVEKAFAAALAADGLLTLIDTKGKKVFVPAGKITFLEIGATNATAVGFRS